MHEWGEGETVVVDENTFHVVCMSIAHSFDAFDHYRDVQMHLAAPPPTTREMALLYGLYCDRGTREGEPGPCLSVLRLKRRLLRTA